MTQFSRCRCRTVSLGGLFTLFYIICGCKVWTGTYARASTPSWHKTGGFCFTTLVPSPPLNWPEADGGCGKVDGTLAVAKSEAAHQALETFRRTLPNSGDPMWIGLKAENGQWTWSDQGLPMGPGDFNKWPPNTAAPTATDGLCVALAGGPSSSMVWKAITCQFPLMFICVPAAMTPSPPVTTAGLAVTSSWSKKYPGFKYTTTDPNTDVLHGVDSPLLCATIATNNNHTECKLFNYSNSGQLCVLLDGVSAIQGHTDGVKDRQWDLWEKEGVRDPGRCPP